MHFIVGSLIGVSVGLGVIILILVAVLILGILKYRQQMDTTSSRRQLTVLPPGISSTSFINSEQLTSKPNARQAYETLQSPSDRAYTHVTPNYMNMENEGKSNGKTKVKAKSSAPVYDQVADPLEHEIYENVSNNNNNNKGT